MTFMTAAEMTALIRKAAAASANAQAYLALERTRERTPTDPDTKLRDSFVVTEATPDDPTAQLSTDVVYAVYQHEALYLRHEDGQAKFMESAVIGGDSKRLLEDAAARAALRVLG